VMSISGISAFARKPGVAEYWLSVGFLALAATLTVYGLICASIAFEGVRAWIASAALGVTVAAVWADVARVRAGVDSPFMVSVSDPLMVGLSNHGRPAHDVPVETRTPRSSFDELRTSDTYPTHPTHPTYATHPTSTQPLAGTEIDALDLFAAPIVGVRRPRAVAIGIAIALPIVAYVLVDAVREFDWNFLLQKLGVLVVWMLAATSAYAIVRSARWPSNAGFIVTPAVVLVVYQLFAWTCPLAAADAYVPVDPGLRLLRDVATAHPSDTARFYAFLRANTLFGPWQIHKLDVAFVEPLRATDGPRPNIFLIVIDSLRRDYLSPYNGKVTFTPAIQTLAADSFVFSRAFTRYAGTALSVPGIWAGGMVPHVIRQPEFARRNTLLKLLNANGYVRVMDMDAISEELVPRDDRLVELDKGRAPMEYDLCRTLDELERRLPERGSHPAFFYTLPQSVHIAVATQRRVPPGESYPRGFDNRIASSVRRVDGCIGGFVDFLKREGEYDNSIIVLTSDHGDSLGEEGRWGHAYYMFPEVMNVPLIVHLPSSVRARVRTDLDAVVFSTDISPSLYAALGYEPKDLGPLFGRSFFAPRDDASSLRRRDPFLVASSYGAVYGTLRQNGRRLYAVDSVDGTEYLFDMTGPPSRVPVTAATAASNRRVIEQQLNALASTLGYER
jgi:sulfatase-like protein